MKNKYIIYVLKDPETKEVRYVGCTKKGIEYRFKQHLAQRDSKNLKCIWVQQLLLKGLRPEIEEVFSVKDKLQAAIAEDVLMSYFFWRQKNRILNNQHAPFGQKFGQPKYREMIEKGIIKYIYNNLHKNKPHLTIYIKRQKTA